MKRVARGVAETHRAAADFLANLDEPAVVCLYGPVGAGKTTFTQGLARALNLDAGVVSPTFGLVREYAAKKGRQGALKTLRLMAHMDLYRVEEAEVANLGLDEYLGDESVLCVVEWPEALAAYLPEKRWEIRFEHVDDKTRSIAWIRKQQ